MLSLVLIIITLVILFLWLYVRHQYSYFRRRNILHEKPKFPLGSLHEIGTWTDMHKFSYNLYDKYKGRDVLAGYYCLTQPEIVIIDLDVIQDILVNDFKTFSDHPMHYNEKNDPLSPHLYALRGERWRNMRTKLSSAFSLSSICAMFDTVSQVNVDLMQHVDRFVQQATPFNAKDISMRYICDSIGSCAFGMNCRAMMDEDPILMKIADRLFVPKRHEMLAYLVAVAYPRFADYIPWIRTPKEVQHYFMGIIQETVRYREQFNVHRNDFMNLLIQMKNNGCMQDDESGEFIGNITTDELIAQAFLLFFFGYHNSRVMLTFALYELASNQKVQERAREEIFRVLGRGVGAEEQELTYRRLEEMTYMQQIADETLRKYPTSGLLERIANEDYVVKKRNGQQHIIEKGTPITIPIMGIQNDPDIYPDPNRFDPDRMTKERMAARHPASFLPLGGGPRLCLGYRFGYLQVKLALVNLLLRYRFTINSRTRQPRTMTNYVREFSVDEDIWVDANRI